MRAEPFRCSSLAAELGEPMYGTASTAQNWILVEQPGPWGWDAVVQSRVSRPVARAFRALIRDASIRVVLLRRPGRQPLQGRHCYLIHSGPDAPWMEHVRLDHVGELLDADLAPLAAGRRTGLGPVDPDPLFLVCTNGARDACCAERGRPMAAALEKAFEDRVWESSHIGGDRFAPNLVCFPYGLYFGRASPGDAPRIARGVAEGVIDLEHYRGRSCYPFDVQAAEYFARRAWGLTGVDELTAVRRTELRPDEIEVELAGNADTAETKFVIRLAIRPAEPPRLLTCKSTSPSRPPRYDLVEERSPDGSRS